ncbi:MAG: DUF3857 domain-containing protein [Chitinophagaceae bacterium]|nr:DUF3857 domain-containing protein [Chitinophagaceae bacterium]
MLLIILSSSVLLFAQKDVKQYKEEAEAIRKEVWAWNRPEFAVREIPSEYANASQVVIARHTEITADSKKKAKFVGLGMGMYRQLTLTEIEREIVKVNDKSALENYSEIAFTQIEKRFGFFSANTTKIYVGVRVIKPDGTVKEINSDDIVLTKDEKREKQAKVAIPDLQVGDMVDYFLAKQQSMGQAGAGNVANYTFPIFDDSPVMSMSVHCEVGKKYAIEYRSYNGAPDFKQSTSENDDNMLDLVQKNIAAFTENNLWISPYRQLPVARMNIVMGSKAKRAGKLTARMPGEFYRNQPSNVFVQDELNTIPAGVYSRYAMGEANLYYNRLLKNKNTIPLDSLLGELYYLQRFYNFLDLNGVTNVENIINMPKLNLSSNRYNYLLHRFFQANDVNYSLLLLLTPRAGPLFKEIMNTDDINYMACVQNRGVRFFGVTSIFSPAFYIPPYFENMERVLAVDTKVPENVGPDGYVQSFVDIPGSSADQNAHIERINISGLPDENGLQVSRRTTLRGHYKADAQQHLILFEDYYEAERLEFKIEQSAIEFLENGKKTKKFAEELKAAFDQARSKNKEAFETEAKEWFEQEVSKFSDYKIENMGVRHTNPDFVYSSKFKMNGISKKAGNNYIIEVGKLQGSPLKIAPEQRKRTLDIYMPFARSIRYEVVLEVPEGYTAEGVNGLVKKVDNECGSFICEAKADGNMVLIKVEKIYKNAFEPVANWDKLLEIIDASADWENAKILLKKK